MKRVVACLLLTLACTDASADSARCHVIYGGEEWTVDAEPTSEPYRAEGKKIGRYFEFKLVYADQPATGKSIRVYTHGMSSGDPVLIHQALYRPPFDSRSDGFGFSGFQYIYEPSKSSELQYWCQHLP